MPITYTFVTSLIIPVSDAWPCADFGSAAVPNIPLFPEATVSRGGPWITGSAGQLHIMSDDGLESSVKFSMPFGTKYTFQTKFKPSSLPDDLLQLNQHRFFIGTFDQQGNSGGVLLSKQGLALVSSFGASALVLPGSHEILEEGEEYYTLRIVVDGEEDVMYLYITKTSDLPLTGHQLRYTTGAPTTPPGTPDSWLLDIVGSALKPVRGRFGAIQCDCQNALIPNKRPIADPGADQTANIGSAVTHNGENSYDPEGQPLTYKWALTDAPDGSRFKISGMGYPVSDGGVDPFTSVFFGGTDAFSEDDAPLLQPYDHLVVEGVVYQIAPTRWILDPATGRYTRDIGGTWNDDEVVITRDVMPDDLGDVSWKVLHTVTYFNDRTFPAPSAIPDISGLYEVQLIVNDGELDSLQVPALLNVSQTSIALGCIPDLSWIWNLLSDFWNLLEDREIVETVWSGFAQAAAAQLMTAWQIDYNKSLLDIQRVFQRRWLSYDTTVDDDPDTATIRIVRGPIVTNNVLGGANLSGKTLQLILDAGSVQTVTFYGADPISVDNIVKQINEQMGFGSSLTKLARKIDRGSEVYVALESATLLRIRPGGTANVTLGFSPVYYIQNDLQGSSGKTTAINALTYEVLSPDSTDFQADGIGSDDLLIRNGESYRIQKIALKSVLPPGEPTEYRALSLLDAVADIADTSWIVPSVVLSQSVNFSDELVAAGDIARFELKDLTTGKVTEVDCEILGVQQDRFGFDPLPLLEFYAGVPSSYRTRFLGVKRVSYIPVDSLVVEIPRLQEVIKDPPQVLHQNTDYLIEKVGDQNTIYFKPGTFSYLNPPPDTFWAEITYLDNRPTIEANFGQLVNFRVEDMAAMSSDLDYLSAVRGLWWAYFGGPSLSKVRTGVQILLGLPFAEAEGTITELNTTFSTLEGRIIIQDKANPSVIRTYFYPLVAGVAINPSTGVAYVEGDAVGVFAPLCGGIEVKDYVSDPYWLEKYVYQGKFLELDKYFWFLVRADVDTFSMANLVFAVDFVKKIKPHYTYPLFVMLKRLPPDEVNETDTVTMMAKLFLSDSFCSRLTQASYRWDDTDESGHWNYNYDDPTPPPEFLHDTHRLCPAEDKWVHVYYIHPGTYGWFFDTIWAYDDGGGADRLPLSGPDSSPPPPYGPLVGIIHHDAAPVAAGVYHRIRNL